MVASATLGCHQAPNAIAPVDIYYKFIMFLILSEIAATYVRE